jgi:O-antigen/teichoic acid export membrane protein
VGVISRFRAFLGRRHNVRAHFWQTLANYTQSGGGMLLGIVLARLLEPSVFGEIVALNATLMFLMIPASFSTTQLLVSDAGKTPDLFSRVLGMSVAVSTLKFLILMGFLAFNFFSGNLQTTLVGAIVGMPMVLADLINTLKSDLEGRGFFKPNFLVQWADLFAHASIAITLVWNGWGIYGLALGGLAGFIPQASLYLLLSDRKLAIPRFGLNEFRRQFRTGFWLWLGSVTSNWFSRIDKILLGHFGSATQLGYYNRAMNYGPASHILLNSFMTNATVRGLAAKETLQQKQRYFFKTMLVVFVGGIVNGLFWWFLAAPLVPLIFGNQWSGAIPSFQILGWLGIPYLLASGTATVLYAEKKFRLIALIHILGLITLVITLLFAGIFFNLSAVVASWIFFAVTLCMGILMSSLALKCLFVYENKTKTG